MRIFLNHELSKEGMMESVLLAQMNCKTDQQTESYLSDKDYKE